MLNSSQLSERNGESYPWIIITVSSSFCKA
jgi:hypothetical protein